MYIKKYAVVCKMYNIVVHRWTMEMNTFTALACVGCLFDATGDADRRKCLRVLHPLAPAFGI